MQLHKNVRNAVAFIRCQRMMDSLIDLTMKKFGWKKMNTEIEERINVKSNESIYTMRFYRTSMQP